MWEVCGKAAFWLPQPTSPRTQKAPQTRGQMRWAILGSNHAGGLGLGDVPRGCWAWVISGSLRFAQNGTLNGTLGGAAGVPRPIVMVMPLLLRSYAAASARISRTG